MSNEFHIESVEIATQLALSWPIMQRQWNGRVRVCSPPSPQWLRSQLQGNLTTDETLVAP
jgi:hypothetical protein